MIINNKKVKAIIFDLDGTLIDSNNIWSDIDKAFFNKRGMDIPTTYVDDIAHIGLYEAAIYTKNTYNIKESIEEIMQEWKQGSANKYLYEIPLKPNALNLLEKLKKENIKLAIATANNKELYIPCLKRLKVYEYFDFIADVDIVKKGKNSVELYDYVAEKLNVKREETAVFEDIAVGLKTAYENGYISVAVYDKNSIKDEELKRKYSHLYINDFKELL